MFRTLQNVIMLYALTFIYKASTTSPPEPAFTGHLPATERLECIQKGQAGDCEFYKCANSHFNCKPKDYPLAYGYRYCSRFSTYFNDFDEKGKRWIAEVRKCLMREIINVFSLAMSCEDLKSFAFNSHPDCYLNNSGDGFCTVVKSNKVALFNVFQTKDFIGDDRGLVLQQIFETAKSCLCERTNDKDKINDFITSFKKKNLEDTAQNAEQDVNPIMEQLANSGDCKFFDIFEDRFPCSSWMDAGHIHDFEADLCQDYSDFLSLFKDKGWIMSSRKCLLKALLPVYRGESVRCQEMIDIVFAIREKCYTDNDFCSFEDKEGNQFALDLLLNRSRFSFYYLRAKQLYRHQIKYLRCKCHDASLTKYKMVYNEDTQAMQKIRHKK